MKTRYVPGVLVVVIAIIFAVFVAANNASDKAGTKAVKGAETSQSSSSNKTDTNSTSSDTTASAGDQVVTSNSDTSNQVAADKKSSKKSSGNVLAVVSTPIEDMNQTTAGNTTSTGDQTSGTTAGSTTGSSDGTGSTGTTGTGTTNPTSPSTDCTAATRVNAPVAGTTAGGFPGGLVTLTFDDGLTSTYVNGLPLLHKYCMVSTQYMISDPLLNNATYANDNGTNDYMTVDQAKQFLTAQTGVQGTEIGAHTVHHCDLGNNQYTQSDDTTACPIPLTAAQVASELQNSKSYLQSIFGYNNQITDLATPYGNYDENTLAAIQAAGYSSHRSTDGGMNVYGSTDMDDIYVQNVESTTTVAQVQAWVDEAKLNNEWLVLVYHDVADTSDPTQAAGQYGITKTDLDAELAYIQQSGIKVGTMAEGVAASNAPVLNGQFDYIAFPSDKSTATAGQRPAATSTTAAAPEDSTVASDQPTDTAATSSDQPASDTTPSDTVAPVVPAAQTEEPVVTGANTQSNAFGL